MINVDLGHKDIPTHFDELNSFKKVSEVLRCPALALCHVTRLRLRVWKASPLPSSSAPPRAMATRPTMRTDSGAG